MRGLLRDVSLFGSVGMVSIETNQGTVAAAAEPRLIHDALGEMFGEDWENQPVEFETDGPLLVSIRAVVEEQPPL